MFSFNNNHIFTGYLKQLLSSINLPTCKIYTTEFTNYLRAHQQEDPRIIRSFDVISKDRMASRTNYLKENKPCNFFFDQVKKNTMWQPSSEQFYDWEKNIFGLTKTLHSSGNTYDTKTHEYLGDFLRFLRDYYNINLMSLYNCFTNKIYTNVYLDTPQTIFDSNKTSYKIYALPAKLFQDYTIAIESPHGIELFCGLYKTALDGSERAINLFNRTYQKVNSAIFNQPFIYDKLNVKYWPEETSETLKSTNIIARCDIANREQDLKLFIKVPSSCDSSITILEGDFRNFNDSIYKIKAEANNDLSLKYERWEYKSNHSILNFESDNTLNNSYFKPISKLQLLAFNTKESYPFADRLVEYLCGSAITPIDGIHDNIKRVQKVMNQNGYYFKTEGLWENKIQKIAYDYMTKLHPKRGYYSKSNTYDLLGYIDHNVEKSYASFEKENEKIKVKDSIQNVDIYNGLFDEE